jgi:glutaredoxin
MTVEIYSKADCALCEGAKAVLREVQKRVPFELVEVDITGDLALCQRFRYEVPVVFIEGQKVFKHRVPPDLFERRLRRLSGI